MADFEQMQQRRASSYRDADGWVWACAKVILFGEHSVVYGQPAIAGGIENALAAKVEASDKASRICIPAWQIDLAIAPEGEGGKSQDSADLLRQTLALLLSHYPLAEPFMLHVQTDIRHASGLGASAALAVACARALALSIGEDPSNRQINDVAYACEQLAHGRPSGLDNSLACFGGLFQFQRGQQGNTMLPLVCAEPLSLLVVLSGVKGFTAATVARVAKNHAAEPEFHQQLFAQIGALAAPAKTCLERAGWPELAELMNENQSYLAQLGVSCPQIDEILAIAKASGALGGKLTGSGDGGAVIIICASALQATKAALTSAGYHSFEVMLRGR